MKKYREELLVENGKDFIPYTFQLPISLVVAKVSAEIDIKREHELNHQLRPAVTAMALGNLRKQCKAVAGGARSSAQPD